MKKVLIYTGASVMCASKETLDALPATAIVANTAVTTPDLRSASKHSLEVERAVILCLNIEGLGLVQWSVLVIRNFANPLLLGVDLLRTYGARINTITNSIVWNPEGSKQRAFAVLRHTTHLPAHSKTTVIARTKGHVSANLLCSSDSCHVVEGLY